MNVPPGEQFVAPMRVCHVASGDVWAGAEVQVATLLGALKGFPELELSALLLSRGRLHDELMRVGISVAVCDESRLSFVRLVLDATRRMKAIRPQILHTHGYKEHVLGAAAGRMSSRPKLVQTYHGIMENLPGWAGVRMRLYDRINVAVGRATTDAIVGVSSEITRILQQRYPSTDVRCIRNGIDFPRVVLTVGRSAMREQLGITADAFVVGTVGRLMPIKGFEYLIEAFAQLRGQRAPLRTRLVVVGDGPLREVLGQCADRHGVTRDVSFLGTRTDVYDLMAAFDVFALPSLHEGVPMVILEAMAVGIPIVASRVGGIPEILEDGKDALLVRAGDPASLARTIGKVAGSPEFGVKLSQAARTRVKNQFSILSSAAKMRDMYQSLSDAGYRR